MNSLREGCEGESGNWRKKETSHYLLSNGRGAWKRKKRAALLPYDMGWEGGVFLPLDS